MTHCPLESRFTTQVLAFANEISQASLEQRLGHYSLIAYSRKWMGSQVQAETTESIRIQKGSNWIQEDGHDSEKTTRRLRNPSYSLSLITLNRQEADDAT